jgi:hypothetical protein
MLKLGAMATAAVIAVGMCSLSTDAFAARAGGGHGGGGHMGGMGGGRMGGMGGAHFAGGTANMGGRYYGGRVAGNGYRGYGYGRYGYDGGVGYGLGWGYPAYTSCYVWTPLGYVNECGYDYSYVW